MQNPSRIDESNIVRSPRKSLAVAKQEIAFYLTGIDFWTYVYVAFFTRIAEFYNTQKF